MMTGVWAAPVATRPLDAVVDVPGSKSLTARALVLAALAAEPTTLVRPLVARDSLLMAAGLEALGARVERGDDTRWILTPGRTTSPAHVDCGLAGTVMRFVPAVAALADVDVVFDGDPRARERPLRPLLDALRALGVRTLPADAGGLPVTVHGAGSVAGGELVVDACGSSQFVSALLLAACRFDRGLHLRARGDVPSLPHVQMTLDALRDRGVEATRTSAASWRVAPGVPAGGEVLVEPDLSNAAVFLAAALVAGGRVRVPGWPPRSRQPLPAVVDLLEAFGGTVTLDDDGLTVVGTGAVHGLGQVDLSGIGELAPTAAALAALADSPTTLRGIAHLRGHETDRLAALAGEITRLGGRAAQTPDGLHIEPAPLRGGVVHAYADHRMATFAALLGLAVPGVEVDDVAATSKTMPEFPALWTGLVA
jgi:3-phosphoshikimate 1-carboxyvinyltransferase